MVEMRVDDKEFQASMKWLAARSRQTLAVYLNRKLFYIVLNAFKLTPAADRQQILSELLTTKSYTYTTKTGKTRHRSRKVGNSIAQRIVQARRYRRGEPIIKDYGELQAAAKKFAMARARSVGTLRAGWLGALRTLGRAARIFNPAKGPRVKFKGEAKPAREGVWNPIAKVTYRLPSAPEGTSGNPSQSRIDPRVIKAFQKAWSMELRSMKDEIAKRMQKDFDRVKPR